MIILGFCIAHVCRYDWESEITQLCLHCAQGMRGILLGSVFLCGQLDTASEAEALYWELLQEWENSTGDDATHHLESLPEPPQRLECVYRMAAAALDRSIIDVNLENGVIHTYPRYPGMLAGAAVTSACWMLHTRDSPALLCLLWLRQRVAIPGSYTWRAALGSHPGQSYYLPVQRSIMMNILLAIFWTDSCVTSLWMGLDCKNADVLLIQ